MVASQNLGMVGSPSSRIHGPGCSGRERGLFAQHQLPPARQHTPLHRQGQCPAPCVLPAPAHSRMEEGHGLDTGTCSVTIYAPLGEDQDGSRKNASPEHPTQLQAQREASLGWESHVCPRSRQTEWVGEGTRGSTSQDQGVSHSTGREGWGLALGLPVPWKGWTWLEQRENIPSQNMDLPG